MKKAKILAVCLCAALSLSVFAGCQASEEPSDSSSQPSSFESSKPEPVINPLTGEDGFSPDAVGQRPVAVMVSNIKDSLPQWGISEADLVYEAVTEGGITRLMCMYADPSAVPKVGPIRSVREYYPQFSEPFHALFVHFGGSTTGYDALEEYNIEDIDGMTLSGTCFQQDKQRLANRGREHTFYTDASMIAAGAEKKGYTMSGNTPTAFSFVEPGSAVSLSGDTVDKATVRFSGYTTATFNYDASTGKYLKGQYGEAHIDANNNAQVAVDNVLILFSPTSVIEGTYLTRYDLTSGSGYYLSGGKSEPLTWSKGDYNKPFVLKNESGATVQFNTGKTWVCVVPNSEKGSLKLENTAAASEAE